MSENNNGKIRKIQKSSKAALVIIRITKILMIVCAVIAIVCGCAFVGAKAYLDQEFDKAMASGEFQERVTIPDGTDFAELGGMMAAGIFKTADIESIAVTLGVYMITAGIILLCYSIALHFVGKVFKDIRSSYSPFTPEIVKNLKVAFVLITVLILQSSLLVGALIGLALWCVFQIFEYGCELQRQSDETL